MGIRDGPGGEGFQGGGAGQPALGQAGKAGEEGGGEAVPGEGEGRASKLSVGGGGEGGGVHASSAAQKVAVEDLCCCCGLGSAWGKGPDLAGVGEDGGDEGVEQLAEGGRGGDAELSAASVQGVQGALASSVEVGGGGGNARRRKDPWPETMAHFPLKLPLAPCLGSLRVVLVCG